MRIITAQRLKSEIEPVAFYAAELPHIPAPKRSGWTDGGLCPFHDDGHAGSFRIHSTSGAFKCFACGAKGSDIISFLMLRDGLGFRETLDYIAAEWGLR